MRLVLCCIHDVKAEAYLNPLVFQAKGQAVRAFADAVNTADHEMHQHPEDYTLFFIGSFDPASGRLYVEDKVSLGNGVDYVDVTLTGGVRESRRAADQAAAE